MNHQPDDRPNDSTLERELEMLVDVDPSPEFLARVRTRIMQEPAPSSWRFGWRLMVTGAAAAVILIAVLVAPWMRSTTTGIPHQATVAEDRTLDAVPPPVRLKPDTTKEELGEEPRARQLRVRSVRLQPDQRGASDAPLFPDVMISEEERQAFENLLLAIQQNRLRVLVRAEDEIEAPLTPAPLEIDQLTIEPLQITRLE